MKLALPLLLFLAGTPDSVTDVTDVTEPATPKAPAPSWRSTEGYKATRWGMTEKELRKAFPGLVSAKDGTLTIPGAKVGPFKAHGGFVLHKGRLHLAIFVIADVPKGTFEKLEAALAEKNGEAVTTEANAPRRAAVWTSAQTEIVLAQERWDVRQRVTIVYRSRELAAWVEAEEAQAEQAELARDL